MSRPTFVNAAFDPELCPLLRGLSREEQLQRMAEDPIIRACVAQLDDPGEEFRHCGAVKAYQKRKKRAAETCAASPETCCAAQGESAASVNA